MAPQTQKQWRVQGTGSFENLTFNESAEVPKLGDKDVLVKCKAKTCSGGVKSISADILVVVKGASLNYRDLIIAKVGPFTSWF